MLASLLITAAKIGGEKTMRSFASIRFAGFVAVMMVLCAAPAGAQDPVKIDPAHYKVELENGRVRVLHVTVEPNGKLEVNELEDAVVVPLRDYESTLKTANGPTKVERVAGKPAWVPAGRREVEAGFKGAGAAPSGGKPPPAPPQPRPPGHRHPPPPIPLPPPHH